MILSSHEILIFLKFQKGTRLSVNRREETWAGIMLFHYFIALSSEFIRRGEKSTDDILLALRASRGV